MQTAPRGSVDGAPAALTAGMMPPCLVVSVHDVSTVTRERTAGILRDLKEAGVPVTSLLVIPDHHRRGRIDRDPVFSECLRGWVARGHEAVLHGFHHLRASRQGESVGTRLITRHYTAGEGEFHDPSLREAADLLREGKEALRRCGVPFTGFIAPAWLLGGDAEQAVRAEGFSYTTRIGGLIDCREGRTFPARSMVYSVRSPWRRSVSLLWNEVLFHALRRSPLLRIGLHPPDWDHEPIRRHILACIRSAARERRVTTYGEWLDQWRASVHERRRT